MEEKMKTLWRVLVGTTFLALLLLFFMPSILSTSYGTRALAASISYFSKAKISIEAIEMSWFREQNVKGLRYKDVSSTELFSAESLSYKNSLLNVFLQRNLFSTLEVLKPEIHFYLKANSVTQKPTQKLASLRLIPAYPSLVLSEGIVHIHKKNEEKLLVEDLFVKSSWHGDQAIFDLSAESSAIIVKAAFKDLENFNISAKLENLPEKLIAAELAKEIPDLASTSRVYLTLQAQDAKISFDANFDSKLLNGKILGQRKQGQFLLNPQTELSMHFTPALWNYFVPQNLELSLKKPLDLVLSINEAKLNLLNWKDSSFSCNFSSDGAEVFLKDQALELQNVHSSISSSKLSKGCFTTLGANLSYQGHQTALDAEAFLKDFSLASRPSCRWTLKLQRASLALFSPFFKLPKSFEKEVEIEMKGMGNTEQLQAKVQVLGKALGKMSLDFDFDYESREFRCFSLIDEISKVLGPWASKRQSLDIRGSLDGVGIAGFHDIHFEARGENLNGQGILHFEDEKLIRVSAPIEVQYQAPKALVDSIFSGKAPFKTTLGMLHLKANPFQWQFDQELVIPGTLKLDESIFGKDRTEFSMQESLGTWNLRFDQLDLDLHAKTLYEGERGSIVFNANSSIQEGLHAALDCKSPSFEGIFHVLLKDQKLLLKDAISVKCSLENEIARKALVMIHPFFQNLEGASQKVSLFVAKEGFELTFKPFNLQIKQASIYPGRLHLQKRHFLQSVFSLLRVNQLGSKIWMTPLYMSAKDGVLECQRMDALLDDLYPVVVWGKIDLAQKKLDMSLALTNEALEKALNITGLSEGECLILPLKGSMQKPKLKTQSALVSIASLLTRTKTNHTALFLGGIIDHLKTQQKVPEQTTVPLPWKEDLLKGTDLPQERETPELFELLEQMP